MTPLPCELTDVLIEYVSLFVWQLDRSNLSVGACSLHSEAFAAGQNESGLLTEALFRSETNFNCLGWLPNINFVYWITDHAVFITLSVRFLKKCNVYSGSHISLAGFHAGPSWFSFNWNLEMLVFVKGGKSENPAKNPRSKDENQQQIGPIHTAPGRISNMGGRRVLLHCAIPLPIAVGE